MSCFLDLLRSLICGGNGDEHETRNRNSFQNRQSYDHYPNFVSKKTSSGELSPTSDEDSKTPLILSSYSKPSKSVSSSSSSSNLLSSFSKAVTSSSKPSQTPSSNLYSSSIQSLSSSVKPHESSFSKSATFLRSNKSDGDSKTPLILSSCSKSVSSSSTSNLLSSSSKAVTSSSKSVSSSFSNLLSSSSKAVTSSSKSVFSSSSNLLSSSSKAVTSSSKPSLTPCPTLKPTLRQAPSDVTIEHGKNNYIRVEQDSLPLYIIPEDINDLIKRDIVPRVLNNSVSPLTYKDFFAALLYAEDYYCEKWSGFEVENVIIDLHKASIYEKPKNRNIKNETRKKVDKTFVAFQIDSVPEKRPFLLSRDLVKVRPSGTLDEPFQGFIYRVVNSSTVLADFRDDFYSQHFPTIKYDISFSFNRVCLKRAHQALNALSDSLFQNFLFPICVSRKTNPAGPTVVPILNKLHPQVSSTVHKILSIKGSPPYVIAGPLCVPEQKQYAFSNKPSRTGELVRESVLQIYESSRKNRILVSAPSNSACDVLMRSLKVVIPQSQMFRVNATFREIEDVPEDILSSSLYKRECFSCPSLAKLKEFRVIFSTFVSSFRLSNEGLSAGYFSHIFLVDASSAIEPETIIPLANFADENTTVIVTGKPGDCPRWIRSDMARKKGLKISYFERLCECSPYRTLDSKFITELDLHEDMTSIRPF